MVYRSSYRKRRPARKRAPRAITYGQIGSKLYKDVQRLKKFINVEVKFTDTPVGITVPLAAAGNAGVLVTNIAQGDTQSTRDGNSVKATSFHYRSLMRFNTDATAPSLVRVMLVQSTFGENDVPLLSDILTTPANANSFQNLNQTRGYKIIMDQKYLLDNTSHESKYIEKNFNMVHHLKYDGTGATDHTFGMIWEFVFTDEITNRATNTSMSRLRYVDN